MKRCSRCGETKPVDHFPPVRRGEPRLQSWCRACFAAYGAVYYRNNRDAQKARLLRNGAARRGENHEKVLEYLNWHPCVDCGETDVIVLEFDHTRDKEVDVARLLASGATWPRIAREIAKCEVRCANCHRLRTVERASRPHGPAPIRKDRPRSPRGTQQLTFADMSLRRCRVCGKERMLADFAFRSRRKGTRHWICRDCQRAVVRAWYEERRDPTRRPSVGYGTRSRETALQNVANYLLDRSCIDCGEDDIRVLDFDHRGGKMDEVTNMARRGLPWETIAAEIARCEIRCANCHRRRTAHEARTYRCRRSEREELRPRGDSNARPDGS